MTSMCDPDVLELVWENGQILVRDLSSKMIPAVNSNGEVPQSSLNQYEVSIQFMTSKEKKSRIDEKSDGVNPVFLRSPALLESNHASSSGATRKRGCRGLAGVGDLEGNAGSTQRSSNPFGMILVEPTNGSKNISRSTEKEGKFMARPTLPGSEPQKESLPDEQSEAVGYKGTPQNRTIPDKVHGLSSSLAPNTAIKGDPGNRKPVEQMVASSSVCSHRASNCPTYSLERSYEDSDLSENATEEPEGTKKAVAARGSKAAKRKRKGEVHNLSERRRRDKINKKMRALKELIPNCNKVDKASMLDEAIEYLKTLQLQVQMMMSMRSGVYIPPAPMMFPSAMQQHMNTLRLAGYSPNSVGMGWRMQMGLGCGPAQFPTSLMSGASALPCFPGQVLLMSMSRSPFVSLAARFSPQPVYASGGSPAAAAARVELPGAVVPFPALKDSNPTHLLRKAN
ncbi:hypothetical protein DITRI_Ditri11bG0127800 [Diplodiscus trichospermus]